MVGRQPGTLGALDANAETSEKPRARKPADGAWRRAAQLRGEGHLPRGVSVATLDKIPLALQVGFARAPYPTAAAAPLSFESLFL